MGYATFFEALGHPARIHIINALRKGERTVSELIGLTKIEQSLLSHNLKKLQLAGFIASKRDGRFIIYSLNKKTIEPLMRMIDGHVEQHCTPLVETRI